MKLENPLLRRAYLYLEDGEWGRADDYCEQVLDKEPENAQAYVIKLMSRLKVDTMEKLGKVETDYEQWNSYRNAYRFADEELRKQLHIYLKNAKEHMQREEDRRKAEQEEQRKAERERRWAATYHEGLRYAKGDASIEDLRKAQALFLQIQDFKDAKEKAKDCEERIAAMEEKQRLLKAQEYEQDEKKRRNKMLIVTAVLMCFAILGAWGVHTLNNLNAEKAKQISDNLVDVAFSGTETDIVSSLARGESFSLAKEMTMYTHELCFHSDGTLTIDTTEFYDQEPFITKNGRRQWDSETGYVETKTWGDVNVSFLGKITVQINGVRCELKVNENNVPISLIWNGTTCKAS